MPIVNRFFSVFRTVARGLEAQRRALGASAENLANASTSRTADGTPYAIKRAVHEVADDDFRRFGTLLGQTQTELQRRDPRHLPGSSLRRHFPDQVDLGPQTEIVEIQRERLEYDPAHPHADANGFVHYPDVNVVEEMARMISANRIYEANLAAFKSAKGMIKETPKI